jgi:tRNA modification GTPase
MDGAIYKSIKEIIDILLEIEAHLTAWVDYPEEGVEDVENEELLKKLEIVESNIEKLLNSYDAGKIFKNGVDTVIVGKPNVGKSTLMNMLSGSDKSIVTNIPGTTRDVVEDTIMIGDIVLNIADTAGLRETEDIVEAAGVKIAKKRLENSYFVIAVFDGSEEFTQEDKELIEKIKDRPCVAVINKTDLERKLDARYIKDSIKNVVEISADSGEGKEELGKAINKILGLDKIDTSGAVVANERQRACLKDAQKEVKASIDALKIGLTLDAVNVCVDYATEYLMRLTGEKASEAIINQVFSNFCVGK